jgi:hypothetical protein
MYDYRKHFNLIEEEPSQNGRIINLSTLNYYQIIGITINFDVW